LVSCGWEITTGANAFILAAAALTHFARADEVIE
jgi:hypothetical protein